MNIILKIKDETGLTLKQISERLGVELRTVQNYSAGKEIPLSIQKLIQYEFFSYQNNDNPIPPNCIEKMLSNIFERLGQVEGEIKQLKSEIGAEHPPNRHLGGVEKRKRV